MVVVNQDCIEFMNSMDKSIDVILTSPPYNTGRNSGSMENHEIRYDVYRERSNEEYIDWSIELFNSFDKVLKPNGVVLYNISYGNENPSVIWQTLAEIINQTAFMVADTIVWKKRSALPNNVSHNKLTRITEFVFVFCRKEEYLTFHANKKEVDKNSNYGFVEEKEGQKIYENLYNLVEAKNNDGACPLNKATYSTELCVKLLGLYAPPNSLIYDPFMGTGTTAMACIELGLDYIGTELSKAQCEWAEKRIEVALSQLKFNI